MPVPHVRTCESSDWRSKEWGPCAHRETRMELLTANCSLPQSRPLWPFGEGIKWERKDGNICVLTHVENPSRKAP